MTSIWSGSHVKSAGKYVDSSGKRWFWISDSNGSEKSFAAALGKGEKEYNKITKCFMSAEKLKEVYENALYIQDQFN